MQRRNSLLGALPLLTLVVVIVVALLALSREIGRTADPGRTLAPWVDYVQGEVIITFNATHMPTRGEVTAGPPRVGIGPLDTLFESYAASALRKLLSWDESYDSEAGKRLERTFVLRYEAPIDAQEMVGRLSRLPFLERVTLNQILHLEPLGPPRLEPGAETLFSAQWYFDNDDPGDQTDIDMPEAWAIEAGGDQNLVLGIFDTGTMLDTFTNDPVWRLHSDFNFHSIDAEDRGSPGINAVDFDGVDNNNDTPALPTQHEVYAYAANIIGFHLNKGFDADPGAELKKRFWYGVPHSWLLSASCTPKFPCPNSWEVIDWVEHGVWVGSIAAGKLDGPKPSTLPFGKDIVGAAYNVKVYNVRFDGNQTSEEMVGAIKHLAQVCRVVNMSFGSNVFDFNVEDATFVATRDHDCVLIAAAGNTSGVLNYPARYDSVLAVGGIRRSPLVLWNKSGYNPLARQVDVVAPMQDSDGGSITADGYSNCTTSLCTPDERAETLPELGTSFAVPQVSGVAALIRTRFPNMKQAEVKQRIRKSGEFYWADNETNRRKYGYGKVNAYRALTEWGSIDAGVTVTWSSQADALPGDLYVRNDTFYVSGDLTIKSGGTLTIKKDLVVRVAPDHEELGSDPTRVQIVVKNGGTLNILGAPGEEVVFESFTDSPPASDDWLGIKYEAGSSGTLQNVVIRNAIIGIEARTPLTLDRLVIEDGTKGVEAHADVAIGNSVIDNLE